MNANAIRRIRRHIAAAGYSAEQIRQGLEYAKAEGASDAREGCSLAMSHILYSPGQLAAAYLAAERAKPEPADNSQPVLF